MDQISRRIPSTRSISCVFRRKEREELHDVVKRLKGSSQKVRRAQVLLKADVRGPNWTDARIADAFSCRVQTVECLRHRVVTEGF